jgi:hypothetical protein
MRVELRQIGTDQLLDALEVEALAEVPQPGRWLEAAVSWCCSDAIATACAMAAMPSPAWPSR